MGQKEVEFEEEFEEELGIGQGGCRWWNLRIFASGSQPLQAQMTGSLTLSIGLIQGCCLVNGELAGSLRLYTLIPSRCSRSKLSSEICNVILCTSNHLE